jgi:hypothetical protein
MFTIQMPGLLAFLVVFITILLFFIISIAFFAKCFSNSKKIPKTSFADGRSFSYFFHSVVILAINFYVIYVYLPIKTKNLAGGVLLDDNAIYWIPINLAVLIATSEILSRLSSNYITVNKL